MTPIISRFVDWAPTRLNASSWRLQAGTGLLQHKHKPKHSGCYSQKQNNEKSSECSSRQRFRLKFLPKFISATSEENVNVSRLDGSKAPRLRGCVVKYG